MRLSNKIAIVTGAGGGIGRATALRFASEGAKVFAADINEDGIRETADLSDAIEPLVVDVSSGSSVSEMVQTVVDGHGRLDIMFSNAGIMRDGNVIDLSENEWDLAHHARGSGVSRMWGGDAPARPAPTEWQGSRGGQFWKWHRGHCQGQPTWD